MGTGLTSLPVHPSRLRTTSHQSLPSKTTRPAHGALVRLGGERKMAAAHTAARTAAAGGAWTAVPEAVRARPQGRHHGRAAAAAARDLFGIRVRVHG